MNRILGWLFVCFGATFLVRSYYLDSIDLLNATNTEYNIAYVLGLVRDISLAVGVAGLIVYSFWKYPRETNKPKAIASIFVSILIGIGISAFHTFTHVQYKKINSQLSGTFSTPETMAIYKEKISSSELTLDKRIALSGKMAPAFYLDSGITVDVVNIKGELVAYTPSEENNEKRLETLKMEAVLQDMTETFKVTAYFWAIWTLASAFMGFIFIYRKNAYNKRMQTDAAKPRR